MGRCMHCDHARLHCNKFSLKSGCKVVNNRKKGVQTIIKAVNREMAINAAPATMVREGRLIVRKATKPLDVAIAKEVYDKSQERNEEKEAAVEDGEITEESAMETHEETDDLFSEGSSNVLGACTSASSCEGKTL